MGVHTRGEEGPLVNRLGRLARYYLDCLAHEGDGGVSTFATSHYGRSDYVELPCPPTSAEFQARCHQPGVAELIKSVRASRQRLTAYVGYPVRLRHHRSPRWEGFFLEPVMLWSLEVSEQGDVSYRLSGDGPVINLAFLRGVAFGGPSAAMEEVVRLGAELGLDRQLSDRLEAAELLSRLPELRPDWDWREPLDTHRCSKGPALSELNAAGVYNRAVLVTGERSPYTVGLEQELRALRETGDAALAQTALGHWLGGTAVSGVADEAPLLEVLPMNSEQHQAIRSAMHAPLTVVTGPPGTGKSQVVTNLLVNAAWRGMKVLFASKNNKAVDVVEARVNGLANRPALLRLGSREYQDNLSGHLIDVLSGAVDQADIARYEAQLEHHRELIQALEALDETRQRTLDARNRVHELEAEVEGLRDVFGEDRFNNLDAELLADALKRVRRYQRALDSLDAVNAGWGKRLMIALRHSRRLTALSTAMAQLAAPAAHLGAPLPAGLVPDRLDEHVAAARSLDDRLAAAQRVLEYQTALNDLRALPSFEQIAHRRSALLQQLGQHAAGLWRDYVNLLPARLTQQQRQDISDYAALLQMLTGRDTGRVHAGVRDKERELRAKVTHVFSCWAITSLSVRGKVPFQPGLFDLVVIDEASQCDIASALPLLFRARRAVIIGDPQQLRHITALSKARDSELQMKHGLLDGLSAWMYQRSLFDLAVGVADANGVINLRDHHRSHADIINFSNQVFYGGRLRVATRYDRLRRPDPHGPGVIWSDVAGHVVRPGGNGVANAVEAGKLVECLRELLLDRGYQGSVGVVTPFRAQAQLIRRRIAADADLKATQDKHELIVDTVHRFQGDERDVIFFSPVVSSRMSRGALTFLRDNGNLFNVAMTRARGLLHVVGDRAAAAASQVSYLAEFVRHVEAVGVKTPESRGLEGIDLGPTYPPVDRPERVSPWEHILYEAMYAQGIRAIPQFSVEPYALDFAVFAGGRMLNIEVDGERYHRAWDGELCLRDQLRNQRMIELGWEVKRFWVYEVRDRLDDCVEWVRRWMGDARP